MLVSHADFPPKIGFIFVKKTITRASNCLDSDEVRQVSKRCMSMATQALRVFLVWHKNQPQLFRVKYLIHVSMHGPLISLFDEYD